MSKVRFTFNTAAIAIFILAVASMTQAQATRTWVSGVGDDVNPCSRTAPCKTFAGAISKTAVGGEIDALDPGGFGAVTITKSITIDGKGTMASILAAGVNGVVVTTAANNGNGIDVAMTNATATELHVRDTNITNCRVGIRMTQPSGFVVGNLNRVNISHVSLDGVQVQTSSFLELRDSTIQFAIGTGVNVTGGAGASAAVIGSLIAHCNVGIAVGASTSRIAQSSIVLNSTGISLAGGAMRTACDNFIDGNPTPIAGGGLTNACVQ